MGNLGRVVESDEPADGDRIERDDVLGLPARCGACQLDDDQTGREKLSKSHGIIVSSGGCPSQHHPQPQVFPELSGPPIFALSTGLPTLDAAMTFLDGGSMIETPAEAIVAYADAAHAGQDLGMR
jgi:hypothetical protein